MIFFKQTFTRIFCILLLFLSVFILSVNKNANAYYAKAFKTGMVESFNLFYTSNTNNNNGFYSLNDIEVGISKYLWAEFEFSLMYGKNNQSHNQTFGLNYFYFRFFSPIYQGEKLNISMGIGMLTPSWYTGKEVGRQMASSEHTRPTFGINIDYNVTKEQRIDWQLFYRQDGQNSIIYSGLSYKINIKPVYTWIYYDNYINATIPENSFAQFIVVMTHPFGKDDRFLAGGSIGYTMGYSDKKFDIAKGFIGAVFCVDFNDLW